MSKIIVSLFIKRVHFYKYNAVNTSRDKELFGAIANKVSEMIPDEWEKIYLYGARDLKFIGEKLDEGEFLHCEKIPLKTLLQMADNGEIRDSKTLICIYKMVRRLGL